MSHVSRSSEIGRRIASLRARRGYSQATVSRRAGLDPSYVSRLERGRIHPTVRTAMKIARALRVEIEDLLGPLPPRRMGRPCPISQSGQCLMDLVAAGERGAATPAYERYSARQLRLLRRFLGVMRRDDPDLLKALEILLAQCEAAGGSTGGRGDA